MHILHTWLKTFNAGDAAGLIEFQQRYLGNSNVAFARDARDETGGFTLTKIEANTPTELSALLRQRNFPSTWQLTMIRRPTNALPLVKLTYLPIPVAQSNALGALSAFADRLVAADKFSGVIAISRHGKRIFGKAWGLADRSKMRPVTLDTRFLIASQGKMFTAVAILQLIARGRLSFDAPIGKYLSDYPNAEVAREVTIRQLLTHTDGLGDIGILQPIGLTKSQEEEIARNRAAVHSIEDIIDLDGARSPAFKPGSEFEYNNYGYIVLGAIIQKISGESYYDYVATHVFQAAGMRHTGNPLRERMAGVAIPYSSFESRGSRSVLDELPWRGMPAGGGVSTAADMIRFVAALNSGTLLPKAMLARAVTNESGQPHGWYGYGFISSKVGTFPYWGHGGGAPGQSLVLAYYPVTDTTFVCMSNSDPPVCDRLAFNYLFRSRSAR